MLKDTPWSSTSTAILRLLCPGRTRCLKCALSVKHCASLREVCLSTVHSPVQRLLVGGEWIEGGSYFHSLSPFMETLWEQGSVLTEEERIREASESERREKEKKEGGV